MQHIDGSESRPRTHLLGDHHETILYAGCVGPAEARRWVMPPQEAQFPERSRPGMAIPQGGICSAQNVKTKMTMMVLSDTKENIRRQLPAGT